MRCTPRRRPTPAFGLRLVAAEDWKELAPVYDAVAGTRPGMPAPRRGAGGSERSSDLPALRGGRSPLRCVVGGGRRRRYAGYARYATKQFWDESFGKGQVTASEVMATDPAALATLYRYLFDLDLMGSTTLGHVPVDDPLLHWLSNPRSAKPVLQDASTSGWSTCRAALTRTQLRDRLDVVLEVTDDDLPVERRHAGG